MPYENGKYSKSKKSPIGYRSEFITLNLVIDQDDRFYTRASNRMSSSDY